MAQLTSRQLEIVMQKAAMLQLQKRNLVLSTSESDLLRTINRGLSPLKNARLEELQDKLRAEAITRQEHRQLIKLTEELERLGAKRLQALIDLAALRKTSVRHLMKEMGLAERGYA